MTLLSTHPDTVELELKEVELTVDGRSRVHSGQILGYRWDGSAARTTVSGHLTGIRYAPERQIFIITLTTP